MAAPDQDQLATLIEGSDLDGLVRHIDRLSDSGDWEGLVELIARCEEAVQRGKQVWGAVQFAEYRLALDAAAPYAASVVRDGAGRYALGPLWEVAASTHGWAELERHIEAPTSRAMVAHERVIRGESLVDADIDQRVVDVPLALEPWEPAYPVAVYSADKADFPETTDVGPALKWQDLPDPASPVSEPDGCDALLDLVRPWFDESSGKAEALAFETGAAAGIRAFGPRRVRIAEVSLQHALAAMTWTGASGGAFGKRRGTPVGRSGAWWALAVLLGMDEEWPPDPALLGQQAASLRWYRWDPGEHIVGWNFHLAVEDPQEGLTWVISAVDAA